MVAAAFITALQNFFLKPGPVESRTKSAGVKVLRVIRFLVLKMTFFFFLLSAVALCFRIMQNKQRVSVPSLEFGKRSDLLFGASHRRRTQGLGVETSVSGPRCRSARAGSEPRRHTERAAGPRCSAENQSRMKKKKRLGRAFAHVRAEIQECVSKAMG